MLPWGEPPWRAWQELHADRAYLLSGYSVPMGATVFQSAPCPIPWTALTAWCDRAGFDDDERTEFIAPIVAALDRAFIAHWQAQKGKPPPDDKLARWKAVAEV